MDNMESSSKTNSKHEDSSDFNLQRRRAPRTIEHLVQQLGGACGLFQVLMVLCVFGSMLPAVWSIMFMVFGNFNPGWVCHGNTSATSLASIVNTTYYPSPSKSINRMNTENHHVNQSVLIMELTPDTQVADSDRKDKRNEELTLSSCAALPLCENVSFSLTASTIVTEWGLICDRAWIPSVIISIQMVGVFIGSYIAGQVSDRWGRRTSIYTNLLLLAVTNLVAVFSTSWEMYAAIRFFIGVFTGGVLATSWVFTSEYLNHFWRALCATFPMWSISAGTFALVVMALKDWKHLHIATAVLSFLYFLNVFWIPESVRFLFVSGDEKRVKTAVGKIATLNKKGNPRWDDVDEFFRVEEKRKGHGSATYLTLFEKTLRKPTLIMGFVWMSMAIIYYGVGFGVQALSGDFFINFILFSILGIPIRLTATVFSSKVGRRTLVLSFLSSSAVICFAIVVVRFAAEGNTKNTSTTVLAFIANMFLEGGWGVSTVFVVELFPTEVRNLSYGHFNACARLGAILAPYIIPKSGFPLFASFLIMGVLLILCCSGLLLLTETKGKPMEDKIDRNASNNR